MSLLSKAVRTGIQEAKVWLAVCYQFGEGADRNEKRASISSAAHSGNEDAAGYLPLFFVNGIGTAKDERKSFESLHKSSTRGNALASMLLALWYKEGIAVPQDKENSKQLLFLARKCGIIGEWVLNPERNAWEISVK